MTQINVPNFEQLVDWVEGRLTPDLAERVAQWVAQADAETQATVAWIRAMNRSRRFGALSTPSPAAKAKALAALNQARQAQQPNLLRRLVAALQPAQSPRLAGTRSGAVKAGHRRVSYVAAEIEIVLEIESRRQDEQFDLTGQLFANDELAWADMTAQLVRDSDGAVIAEHHVDELGEFTFEAIPASVCTVLLRTTQSEIELPAVHLANG